MFFIATYNSVGRRLRKYKLGHMITAPCISRALKEIDGQYMALTLFLGLSGFCRGFWPLLAIKKQGYDDQTCKIYDVTTRMEI